MDGIAKAKDRGVKFGRKRELTDDRVEEIRALRQSGETVPAIIKRTGSVRRASIERLMHNKFSIRRRGAPHQGSGDSARVG